MIIRAKREVEYPERDGKPMAETTLHMRQMIQAIYTLIDWFANPNVLVWGNLLMYYVPGNIRKSVAPDIFVVKGVERDRERRVYLLWEEGHSPCATIEISSRKTRKDDLGRKFELYRDVLKVHEYFLFDPLAEYLDPPLQGYRLRTGEYRPIRPVAGRLPSLALGLHLEADGEQLRFWNSSTLKWLATPEESRQRAVEAKLQAEAENQRLRAELAALRRKLSEGSK
jgi:Uma2 family endonuclease